MQLYVRRRKYFIFHCRIPDILDKLLLLRFSQSCQDQKYFLSKKRQKKYFFEKLNLISMQFPAFKVGESHILSETHLSLRISKVFVIQLLILEFIMIVTNIYRGLLYVGWWSCKDLCKPVKESLRLWYLKFRSFKMPHAWAFQSEQAFTNIWTPGFLAVLCKRYSNHSMRTRAVLILTNQNEER